MRITYEKDGALTLIYIYLREFDGNISSTISCVKANILYDKNLNWIGIEVFNISNIDKKVTFNLPILKNPYTPSENELVICTKESIYILFNSLLKVCSKLVVDCNVDLNNTSGLLGIELILDDFNSNIDIAKKFMKKPQL